MARTTTSTARTTTSTARKGNTVTTTTRKRTAAAPAASTTTTARTTRKAVAPVTYRGVAVAGYTVRWPHGGYDLLKTTDAKAERAAWLVRCNVHGETGTVENTRQGDACGSRASRATWCGGCIKDAAPAASTTTRKRSARAA